MASSDPLKPVPEDAKGLLAGAAFNRFAEATRWVNRRRQGQTAEQSEIGEVGNVCLVKNNSGSNLKRFKGFLGIGAPVISADDDEAEFKRQIAIQGATPASATHHGRFVVLLENIPDGEFGRAMINGVTHAWVDIKYTSHRYCDIADGYANKLESCLNGSARILTPITETGEQWVTIAVGYDDPHGRIYKAKSDGTITAGSNGTVSIWINESDSTENVTAYFNHMETDASDISSTHDLVLAWFADESKWVVIERWCG